MKIDQPSLFAVSSPQNTEQQQRIALHNRSFETPQPNPYGTAWDTAIHTSDARAEAMLRLRTLLHQQLKKCPQNRLERARFLDILQCEMRLKQSTTDAAQWVRKALLAFNNKS